MLKTKHREKLLVEACLAAKQSFVVDKTNVSTEERAKYIAPAKARGFDVVGYYFRSNFVEALRRNNEREAAARVPERGLLGTLKRLQKPALDEGFDRLFYVSILETGEFLVEAWTDEI